MMSCLFLLLLMFLSIFSITNSADIILTRRIVYYLNVSYAENSSSIVLINNQIPGPLIEAESNDILVVHVTNNLPETERLAIHFHGMFVRQTPQMDGVGYVTQMPIESQRSFTYVFHAYPAGTYFYHSHSGLQSVTAFGPLIVHDTEKPWNIPEVSSGPLLFSDLWFEPGRLIQEQGLLASPFVWEGEPTYLLINGKRNFVLTVDPNKKYLLRLIGATSLSTIVFGIYDHIMTVVEVDGTLIKPKNVSSIELSSGQRYAVTIQTKNQATGIFLMQLSIRWRTIGVNSSCTGILRYGTLSQIPTNLSSFSLPLLSSEQDLLSFAFQNPYQTLFEIDQMPIQSADKEIYLYNYQAHTSDGLGIRWFTNNGGSLDKLSLSNLSEALLFDVYNGIEQNLPNDVTYSVGQNQLIDIVLQNTVALNGVCESHPFHLHGHKFWIHSQGTGMYSSPRAYNPNIQNPILRDTAILYASSYSYLTPNRTTANYKKPCGWIKIRFISDNPGLWLLHCHIGSHLYMGMSVLLEEDIEHLTMNFFSQN